MKTTLDLTDELLARAKRVALERDITLRALIEEALERAIGSSRLRWEPLTTVTYGDPSRAEGLGIGDAMLRDANPDTDSPDYVARRLGLPRTAGRN